MALLFAAPAAAQRVELVARVGVTVSTPLVEDQVATPSVPDSLDAPVDGVLRAGPAPAPLFGVGVRVGFWETVQLEAAVDYASSEVEVEESGGSRTFADMSVITTLVGAGWAVTPAIELGGGVGLIWYDTEERGVFAGGIETSPVVEGRIGWVLPVLDGRVTLLAAARTHRFGTPAIRRLGGVDGGITRASLSARVRLAEVVR